MTGWRLGYNIAPPALTQAMLQISQQFSRSAATFTQFAGVAALNGPQDEVDNMVKIYARRRDLVSHGFSKIDGLNFSPPEGTFFFFLNIKSFGMSSQSICSHLMEQAHVVSIPGCFYGSAGEGYIRMSFAYNEEMLRNGVDAIVAGLKTINR